MKIDNFINTYDAERKTYYKSKTVEETLNNHVEAVFNIIREELEDLKTDVDTGLYSQKDITDRLEDIIDKI